MSRKIRDNFKTYAQLQAFISEILKSGSHRAMNTALSKTLIGKEVTFSVVSAVLIAASKQNSVDCAIQFMQFTKNIYNFQFSAEHFTLALRCGIDRDLLLNNFFDSMPNSQKSRVISKDNKSLPVLTQSKNTFFQYRTHADIMQSPIVKYYIAQKILRNGRDVAHFTELLNESFSSGICHDQNSHVYFRMKSNLFAKVNILQPFASYSTYKSFAIGSSDSRIDCIKNLPNIIAATNPDLKREMIRLHNMGLVFIQSLGSSLAASFLNISPGMNVLDLCAAPGNKTLSILEKVGPQGCVIANDQSSARVKDLYDRFSLTPTANLLVTSYPAAEFPSHLSLIRTHSKGTLRTHKLKFDRILVDISCSGDGRILKDSNVLMKWNALEGLVNFASQKKATMRALHLVDVEGLVLYCTCSMNPVENEAVVASILRELKDAVRIVRIDHIARNEGFDIKLRPGMTSWGVPMGKNYTSQFQSHLGFKRGALESISQENSQSLAFTRDAMPNDGLLEIPHYHEIFPHHADSKNSTDDWIGKSLKECRRLMVTDNEEYTTGFFFALFKKVKEIPSSSEPRAIEIKTSTNRRLQVLDILDISREFFLNYVIMFHINQSQVSYIINKALSQELGATCLTSSEKLVINEGKAFACGGCQLSVDEGKTLTHQAAQIIGPYAKHTRIVRLDFKAFIYLIQFRRIGEVYFTDFLNQLRKANIPHQSRSMRDLPFMRNLKKIHGRTTVDGPILVTVDKSECCYTGIYLYGELVNENDEWLIQCTTLLRADRDKLLEASRYES